MWWLIPVAVIISFLSVFVSFYVTVSIKIVRQYLTPKKRTDAYLTEYESREKGLDVALLELPFENLTRKSRFGYSLRARYYAAEIPSDKILIDLHGHNSSSVSQLKYLKMFRALGYNILLPDHRASGESGGKSITFGDKETADALDWITELRKKYPKASFGVYGESMGGAIALRVAAEIRPTFVVSYAAYNTIKQLFNDHSHGKAKYFMPMIDLVASLMTGARLKSLNGEKTVNKIECPILLMHSKADTLIPLGHEQRLYAAAVSANKDVREHIFEASKHTRSWSCYPEEFEKEVSDFIRAAEKTEEEHCAS